MVAFEVERFEWSDGHLVVSGRWYGLRGHRFVRPALMVEAGEEGDDRRRMLADLEHKPWAADEGSDWIAAFPWDGEPVQIARAELAVAPTLAVDLPRPRLPGRRSKTATEPPRPARRPPATRKARSGRDRRSAERDDATEAEHASLARERDAAVAERKAVASERDRLAAELGSVAAERDAAVAERDARAHERDEAVSERDSLTRERDEAARQRDALTRERDAAVRARAAAVRERDELRRSLAAAVAERDRVAEARTGLLRERDAARAARQRDLEVLAEPDVRRVPPPAARPAAPSLRPRSALVLWGQRFVAVVALGVLAFVVYTLLERVV
jgi:hypothetical protein